MNRPKVLITAALPYANGALHFGHIAGAYLPADCYARYQRLVGADVLFICGSDEHGVAVTLSAELAERTPQEQVDLFHAVNKDFFADLGISFDHYSRTTWPGHVKPTQTFFLELLENGFIEEKETEQLYSEADKRFLADRYVVGTCPKCRFDKARGDECPKCGGNFEATDLIHPKSKISGAALTLKSTKHHFLRFDLFKDKLQAFLKKRNWKPNVVNFVKNYIDDLKPRAITRDSDWGIPVPLEGYEGKVLYVWFDAPIGYISASREWSDEWEKYWLDERTKYVQFIGKDNIPFHAIFFPAMCMGQNTPYKLVDDLPANEFLNLEGKQFSKSENWTIDLDRFFKNFSSDQIRYYLAAIAPETQDSEFIWKDFQLRCNSELLGKYGNLVNRVLVFLGNKFEHEVPTPGELLEVDQELLNAVDRLVKEIGDAYSHYHLRKATALIMELAALGNVYFDQKQPWKDKEGAGTTLALCLTVLRALALVSSPVLPETASKLWAMLGYSEEMGQLDEELEKELPFGRKLPHPEILFKKVEDELIEQEIASLGKKGDFAPTKEQITFDHFGSLDLRTGEILTAEPIPKSKKLLKLSVDIGFEKRQIVAGIAEGIQDIDALIGQKVVIVANLKPAKLMGVKSEGMLLAAHTEKGLELLSLSESPPGSTIR
ncbi:MAG: Methionine--tRNA ligase [Chlamydiia bacterium]|nr:Methionine--tRNA ligase [Chlamydiia bacterium]MCH9615940.1 Methionine--tRNA ligase [Chlamydiia bacterium]MCH9628657.1 Methionine--tRNA ligase [Chlamydiia bacterium]